VNFILGGVVGFSFPALFRTLLATLCFVGPILLFGFIQYIDRKHVGGNLISFLAGGVAGFAFFLYVLFQIFAGVPGLSGM